MKKIDFTKIWIEINAESQKNPESIIARRIHAESREAIFIASDYHKCIRSLYVDLSSGIYVEINKLPKFRGLDICETICSVGDCANHKFLKISQNIPSTENIFELFVSDICTDVANLKTFSQLESVLTNSLNEWKVFFEKYITDVLPLYIQQGLFGELLFISDFMLQKYSAYEAILFWTGSRRTTHDFQLYNGIAIEVKTSSAKQHRRISISSEKQLYKADLSHLFLVFYILNIHDNFPEKSLAAKIAEIRSMIADDPVAISMFDAQLMRIGYNVELSGLYTTGLSVISLKLYEIKEGFPAITPEILPEGTGDVKYSIAASACQQYEINKQDILKQI